MPGGLLEDQGDRRRCGSSGRIMPRRRSNRSATSNVSGRMTTLPASTFARSSRSLTSSDRPSAALRMKPTCFSCSAVSSPSAAVQQEPRTGCRIEFSGVRNSWLMLDRKRVFSSETRRSELGLLVELGVEGDHAAVGLLQLAVDAARRARPGGRAAPAGRGAAPGSAAGPPRAGPAGACRASSAEIRARSCGVERRPAASAGALASVTVVPPPGRRLDLEAVHQPPGADDARGPCRSASRTGRRGSACRSSIPGPRSRTRISEARGRLGVDQELDPAAAGVLEGVAGDLRDGGGDPRLVLRGRSRAGRRSGGRAAGPGRRRARGGSPVVRSGS